MSFKLIQFFKRYFKLNKKFIKFNNLFNDVKKKDPFVIFIDLNSFAPNFNYVEYLLYGKYISKNKNLFVIILPKDNFVDSYLKGETPIPCVQCNQTVKFKDLFEVAKDLKADALITGHYVKSVTFGNETNMYRAIDENRDQSYFLFNTTREQLNYLRFPLGGMLKDETRSIAKELDLNVADKPDSQDICFVPSGDYASVIRKFRPDSLKKGNIKNLDGKVIGVHDGIINFTIGQRKGIKVSNSEPLYVIKINSEKNEIVVGPKEKLGKKNININNLNLLVDKKQLSKNILVKVRSTGKLLDASVNFKDDNSAEVNLKDFEDGISPGQACVFYDLDKQGHKVLGGGWIIS